APLASLGVELGASRLVDLYSRLGFFTAPAVRLPSASTTSASAGHDPVQLAIGNAGVAVSPLQMAVAAAGLSQDGMSPSPRLAVSFLSPNQGWVILPALGQPVQEFPTGAVGSLVDSLRTSNQPLWTTTGSTVSGDGKQVAWFIGGTLPSWNGTPLAVAVALEKGDPQTALSIGSSLLQAAIK
ncbi:MAG TPA: penicillin-binding transpeptidase domain-containing protein, partial [Anaerolineaceae bacterium]